MPITRLQIYLNKKQHLKSQLIDPFIHFDSFIHLFLATSELISCKPRDNVTFGEWPIFREIDVPFLHYGLL